MNCSISRTKSLRPPNSSGSTTRRKIPLPHSSGWLPVLMPAPVSAPANTSTIKLSRNPLWPACCAAERQQGGFARHRQQTGRIGDRMSIAVDQPTFRHRDAALRRHSYLSQRYHAGRKVDHHGLSARLARNTDGERVGAEERGGGTERCHAGRTACVVGHEQRDQSVTRGTADIGPEAGYVVTVAHGGATDARLACLGCCLLDGEGC